jgi:hypothetical protein
VSDARTQIARYSFPIGVVLIIVSFVIYPAYPVIALLPFPVKLRVIVAVAASAVSWGVFFVGSALAGKPGVDYVKRLLARRKPPPPPLPDA